MLAYLIFAFLSAFCFYDIPKDLTIELNRGCGGLETCLEYKVTIDADGGVKIEEGRLIDMGLPDNRKPKTIKSRIPKEKLQQLVDEFDKIKFFSLKDDYTATPPLLWTRARRGGRHHLDQD